jgi:hypothetical protein
LIPPATHAILDPGPVEEGDIVLRHFILISMLVVLLAAAAAVAAEPAGQAWTGVTVATTEGWNMPDCTVQWLDDGLKVRVTRPDGTWRDFDPWLVKSIKNPLGADITSDVAAARPGGDGVPAPALGTKGESYGEIGVATGPVATGSSGNLGEAVLAAEPKIFKSAFTAGVGYGTYAGDWFTGFQSDLSLHGDVRIGTGGKQWLALGYRRQGGGSEEGYIWDDFTGDYYKVAAEVDVHLWRLGVGARVGQPTKRAGFMYIEASFLAMHHVAKATVEGYGSDDYSETKLGFQFLFGGMVPVAKNVVVDVSADVVTKDTILHSDESGGFIFGVRAGIGFVNW